LQSGVGVASCVLRESLDGRQLGCLLLALDVGKRLVCFA
jgi:hypothetical protein